MKYKLTISVDTKELFDDLSEQDKYRTVKEFLYSLSDQDRFDLVKEMCADLPEKALKEILSEYTTFLNTPL